MGSHISFIWHLWFNKREMRVLMLGLDAAGKTTILYKLRLGEVVATIPTIGFNVETIIHKNITMTVWDVGRQEKLRPLLRHYYTNTAAVIFVVDSGDRNRVDEAKEELHQLTQEEELNDAIFLIFANKQDFPGAMDTSELTEKLDLCGLQRRAWHIVPCSALTDRGLSEGLDWLSIANKDEWTTAQDIEPK